MAQEVDPTFRVSDSTFQGPDPIFFDKMRERLLPLFFVALPLSVAIQQTLLGVLLALVVVYCWRERKLPTTVLDGPLFFLFGAFLLSTLFSPAVGASLLGYRKLWLVGAFFVTAILLTRPHEAERAIKLMVVVTSIIAAYGIVQHYTGLDLNKQLRGKASSLDPFWFGRDEGFRTKGIHPSGITFAHNLLFPLTFVTVWLSWPKISWRQRLFLFVSWGLMIFALLFSLTRGVWVAYAAVVVVLGVVRGGRTLAGIVGGSLLLGTCVLGAGAGVQERLWSTFDFVENLPRSQIWQANIDMIKERPLFGWGYGNYRQFRDPFYERYPKIDTTAHAHNNFLQLWVDSGVVGLVAFLYLFVVVLRLSWRTYRHAPLGNERLQMIALGVFLSLIGFLVGGMTQYNFGDAEVVLVMWSMAGLITRMHGWVEKDG
ncbi:MAG: O-antigen ligase family protein [Candidatus Binatia bacterium]